MSSRIVVVVLIGVTSALGTLAWAQQGGQGQQRVGPMGQGGQPGPGMGRGMKVGPGMMGGMGQAGPGVRVSAR